MSTTTLKNSLSRPTTSARPGRGQLGGTDQIDEEHRDVALLSAEFGAALQRPSRDILTDVAAEQIPHPLTLAELANHIVEAGLQQT